MLEKDGTASEVSSLTKFGFGVEEGAIRIMEKSGKWVPAQQLGKALKCVNTLGITYKKQANNNKFHWLLQIHNGFRHI